MTSILLQVCFLTIFFRGIYAVDHSNDELLERIQYLEEQGTKFAHVLVALESKIEIQNKQLDDQQLRITELEKENAHLKQNQNSYTADGNTVSELKSLESKIELQTNQLDEHQLRISELENENARLEKYIQNSKIQENNSINNSRSRRSVVANPVGFHAVIKKDFVNHTSINQNIVFPDVLLNIGGGYHNQHGIFIAPKNGLYFFSVSISGRWTDHMAITVNLLKNGNILANAIGAGNVNDADQGSITVLTQLVVGDEVWVRQYNQADTSLFGDSFDSFMGLLVHET